MVTKNCLNYGPTDHTVQVGSSTGNITSLTAGTNGRLLIGSGGANPIFATLGSTGGSLSYTAGAGSLSASAANYAVGTFTPTLVGASTAGTTTYVSQAGYYTRFLDMCFIYGKIEISSATGTGNVLLGGFPFTIRNTSKQVGAIYLSSAGWTWGAGYTRLGVYGLNGTATANIFKNGSAVVGGFLGMVNTSATLYYSLLHHV